MKKQIISMMLSMALVVTAMPVETVNASEIVVQEGEVEETTKEVQTEEAQTEETHAEETQTVEAENTTSESTEVQTEIFDEESKELDSFAKAFQICTIGEAEKVIGSNGVAYDEVTYLSVDAVRSMDDDKREQYVEICDEISSWVEGGYDLNSAVIALDADGELNVYWSVPTMELSRIQSSMLEDMQAEDSSEIAEVQNSESEES